LTGAGSWGERERGGHPSWHWMVLISLAIHALGIALVAGLEKYLPRRSLELNAISVRLVGSVPGPALTESSSKGVRSSEAPSGVKVQEEAPKASSKKVPIPVPQAERKAVSIQPTEMKTPERSQPTPIPEEKGTQKKGEGGTQGVSPSGSGPKVAATQQGGGGGGTLSPEEARYLQMLQERIEESWRAYVPAGEGGVLGEVRIQISRDGKIRELTFLKGSGKSHVDSSIVSALNKVVLPPPPPTLAERPLILRFWPSGPGKS
jgi:outer membrane biosynthesis protein TonB